MFSSKTQNKQLLCSYGVFIINGMLALSIGSLLPYIRDARGLEYAFCGMIVSLHSVGNLISTIECKSNDFRKPYDSYLYSHRTPSETWKENRVITEVC